MVGGNFLIPIIHTIIRSEFLVQENIKILYDLTVLHPCAINGVEKVRRMNYSLRYKGITMTTHLAALMSCIPLIVHQPPVADVTGKCGMRVSVIDGKIL